MLNFKIVMQLYANVTFEHKVDRYLKLGSPQT